MRQIVRWMMVMTFALGSVPAWAAAVVEILAGDVRAGASVAGAAAVRQGQRIEAGAYVVTGARSNVLLRFDDGQAMYLSENSEFRIAEYAFSRQDAARDRFVFDLLKGALRSVTAAITGRNPQAYALRVPQATLGIRGTDFMVALVNPAYMSVLSGAISATNAAGAVTFAAGATATVASATTLATSIAASALPASVASSFSSMGSVTITASAAAGTTAGTGAGAAGGAAAGGITAGAVAAGVAAAAALSAAISSDDSTSTTTTGTTGTSGTSGTSGTR